MLLLWLLLLLLLLFLFGGSDEKLQTVNTRIKETED